MSPPHELTLANRLSALRYGPCATADTGVAVLCSPGGMARRSYFEIGGPHSLATRLSTAGLTCYLVDTLGTGRSDPQRPGDEVTRAAAADALAAAADALHPHHRDVAGLGHSLGAWLTVHAQARASCFDCLVLLGYAPGWRARPDLIHAPSNPSHRRAWILDRQCRDEPDRWTDSHVRFPTPLSADHPLVLTPVPRALALDFGAGDDTLAECANIDVPVYLGFGDQDVSTPELESSHYPRAPSVRTYVLPSAGHAHALAPHAGEMWHDLAQWLTQRSQQRKDGDSC